MNTNCQCNDAREESSPLINSSSEKSNRVTCGGCVMFPSCMSMLSKKGEQHAPRPGQVPVVLNVYDMYWTNWYTAGAGVGVFHSGVQVHGSEWAYGGHPYSFTGVFEISPRDARELGDQFHFRQSVHIGYTDFSEDEVRRLVAELGKQFRGDRYHLMNNNCNHFSSAFCQALCNRDIPSWVNRLAYVSSCVPFLQRCLPNDVGSPRICSSEPDQCRWSPERCRIGPSRCRADTLRCIVAPDLCQTEDDRCCTQPEPCATSEECAIKPCTSKPKVEICTCRSQPSTSKSKVAKICFCPAEKSDNPCTSRGERSVALMPPCVVSDESAANPCVPQDRENIQTDVEMGCAKKS
ncbi:hypothetical protein O0L34_g18776 [Tuta absoluta]|nr:hypothetical protein O0L34_g18776 [Tuta absoluta]